MSASLEVYERTVKYGYLYWIKKDDPSVLKELNGLNGIKIEVFFNNISLGLKNIDISHRRISIGTNISSGLKVGSKVRLSRKKDKIEVTYK